MAGGWSTALGPCNSVSYGQLTASSSMTSIAANATANTKGSYTQLTASSTAEAAGVIIQISGATATGSFESVDLAVGAAGSEKIIAADLMLQDFQNGSSTYFLPISIPIGSRIAARTQGSGASDSAQVGIITLDGGCWADAVGGCNSNTIGFTGGGTYGTVVDPGATANTAGAWVQLTASAATDYSGFVLGIARSAATSSLATYLLDVAVGAAGSEKVILSQYPGWTTGTSGQLNPTVTSFIGLPIAAGSRIAVRGYCSSTTSALRTMLVVMYATVQ